MIVRVVRARREYRESVKLSKYHFGGEDWTGDRCHCHSHQALCKYLKEQMSHTSPNLLFKDSSG